MFVRVVYGHSNNLPERCSSLQFLHILLWFVTMTDMTELPHPQNKD